MPCSIVTGIILVLYQDCKGVKDEVIARVGVQWYLTFLYRMSFPIYVHRLVVIKNDSIHACLLIGGSYLIV